MVFFTCNACGESLKKAQVDKHVARCGGCRVLSCIDCGVDFRGNDYRNHVTCISEDQKYGGKGYEAKVNKGQVKQQQWIQKIQEAMSKPGISQKLKDVLSQVSSYDNVPRKKAKFQNWMKNSLKIHGPALHDEVWNIFSAATSDAPQESGSEQRSEPEASGTAENGEEEGAKEKKKNKRERKEERQKKHKRQRVPENGAAGDNGQAQADSGPSEKAKKKKRRKMEEEEVEDHRAQKKSKKENLENEIHEDADETQEEQEGDGAAKGKFNWKGTIKAVLMHAPEEGISVKKLRKKVLAEYYTFTGDGNHRPEVELYSLFNKKMSNPKFKILKEKVRLVK